ncbi:MAG: DNA adenine methylase [Treponema sp.]|jgi:DNA adenine methylase|nr:DNA adenine methylase [Treponema sp.]
MIKNDSLIKPFLKWAGGKRQLLPAIRKCLPAHINNYTYYEPFLGAGAVFFELQPQKAVINDLNTQLIMTYMVIKGHVEALIKLLNDYQNKNIRYYFYQTRNLDRDPQKFERLSDTEKAARLIFLNKTCFNGLYRVNSKGLFNVPYGNYKNPVICEESVLRQISSYLNTNDISIINYDFEIAVVDVDKHSFVYFDPPYHSPDKTNFTRYHADGFGEAEQERLRNVFVRMAKQGAKCLLSNSDTDFIRELYKDYEILPVQAKRAINSNTRGRGFVNEVLIKNWKD